MNNFLDLFQGIAVMVASDPVVVAVRAGLVILGFVLVWLGRKGILEPLLMIPMGLGMATINVSSMFFDPINMANKTPVDETAINNLFLDSTISNNDHLMTLMQIDWLQPVYTLTFSNGLIACLIFIGIGSLLDVGFVMKRPYVSAIIALFAELGTLLSAVAVVLCVLLFQRRLLEYVLRFPGANERRILRQMHFRCFLMLAGIVLFL